MSSRPTGIVTFLFTDIEGSTKLSQEFPESIHNALEIHNAIMLESVESNNGFVFEIIGDAFCCAFLRPEEAVTAAVIAQKNLSSEVWKDAVIKSRIGIHSGPAEWSGSRYMGYITLARTSRVMSSAYGEQIIISSDTYELVKEKLFFIGNQSEPEERITSESNPLGISFRDLGDRRLKDLIQPVKLFQVVAPGLREDFPPLKTLDARPNNIPGQLTSFIGREEEMKKIKSSLGKNRLITLTGPGGTGKTRLALQIAADIIDEFSHGVWIAELSTVQDPELLPDEILNSLGIKISPNVKTMDLLSGHLKQKEILLILDNCEHLIDACANLVERLLVQSPKLRIITTSREALRCNGEVTHQILSLDSPDPKDKLPPEKLIRFESIRLFIERALTVNSSFRLSQDNAYAVEGICYKLDGIPLAIELAAARTKVLSVEKIYQRIDNRFNLLTGGMRTALPRQQTLKALIDWSYDLLSNEEKILWRRLSVFSGGWNIEESEEICSDENILLKENIIDLLVNLTDKSIINLNIENGRYKMLETIKQYGQEKFNEAEERQDIMKKHLDYFIKYAESRRNSLRSIDSEKVVRELDLEKGNIEIAFLWSIENSDISSGTRFAWALSNYWSIRGFYSEGLRFLESLLMKKPEKIDQEFCKIIYLFGKFARFKGDLGIAKKYLEESLQIWRECGYRQGITDCLNSLGINEFDQGRLNQAVIYYKENLNNYKETGNKQGIAVTLNNLGNALSNMGDYKTAVEYYEESLKIRRELNDKLGIGITVNNLGILANERGDYIKATELLTESLKIRRENRDSNGISITLQNLGNISYYQGDYEKAFELYEESRQISQELDQKSEIAKSLNDMGKAAFAMGKSQLAFEYLSKSFQICREIGAESDIAFSLYFLGRIEFVKKEIEKAMAYYVESLNIYKDSGNLKDMVLNILSIAELKFCEGCYNMSANLLGYLDKEYIERNSAKFAKPDQITLNELTTGLRDKLGVEKFTEYYDEGKSLTIDDVLKRSSG